jgi:hypothetical protein
METSVTVIYRDDGEKGIISMNAVPGHQQEQSTYNSKLARIEGALLLSY